MKTIEAINTEIQSLSIQVKRLEGTYNKKDLRESKKLRNRITYLREMVLLLKSYPNESFLKEEKNRIERRQIEIKKLFDSLIPPDANKLFIDNLKKEFNKEWKVDVLKFQLKFINSILSE